MIDAGIPDWLAPDQSYRLHLAEEQHLRPIIEFLSRHGIVGPPAPWSPDVVIHVDPFVQPLCYREINVRHQLYNFTEEFILMKDGEELQGLVGIRVPKLTGSRALEIALIAIPRQNPAVLKAMVEYAQSVLPSLTLAPPTKMRLNAPEKHQDFVVLAEWLQEAGFVQEARGEDELDWGHSVVAFALRMESVSG